MRRIFSNAKINLLSRLSVANMRRRMQQKSANESTAAPTEKQLLVDVSVIIHNDGRTGIQRVVRALLLQLHKQCPHGWKIRPVFATRKHEYRYASESFGLPDAGKYDLKKAEPVKAKFGDIFLGLDLAAHILPAHQAQLQRWKQQGVQIDIIVYDLLPVLHQQWFNAKTTKNFHRWLRTIAVFADGLICISNTVRIELENWMSQQYDMPPGSIPISTIPLGADIQSSAPSYGLPDNIDQLISAFSSHPTVLMVGTLEPRKGHGQVLAAFEKLWQQGKDINLVFVGKPGWKTEKLQQQLRTHPQNNKRLYWLDHASDELLELLYDKCTGVMVGSQAEGYGLPLIEAQYHRKHVLARDIPVLREIGGNAVTFFSDPDTDSLRNKIISWLTEVTTNPMPNRSAQHTWQESARVLLAQLVGPGCEMVYQDK